METYRTARAFGIDSFASGLLLSIVIVGLLTSSADPNEAATADEVEQAITRVTEGLRSEIGVSGRGTPAIFPLATRMKLYSVPGVSIAVVEQGQIVWARGFGITEAGTTDLVNSRIIFQAGSISKAVAATGMLRLVREGVLELDKPVNEYLKSWSLPENSFTINEKVTLRRIASHSGGLTVHGFPGYTVDDRIDRKSVV